MLTSHELCFLNIAGALPEYISDLKSSVECFQGYSYLYEKVVGNFVSQQAYIIVC